MSAFTFEIIGGILKLFKIEIWRINMKNVVLSADSERIVYSVPNEVADNLEQYCLEFCNKWLFTSPSAEKYRINGGVCYNESDFIEYLNTWIFPNQQSIFIKNLGWIEFDKSLPKEYKDCPEFNF